MTQLAATMTEQQYVRLMRQRRIAKRTALSAASESGHLAGRSGDLGNATSLSALVELTAVASRSGLLNHLLTVDHLSQLKRWSIAIKLAEMDDTQQIQPPSASDTDGDVDKALARVLAVLSQTRRCFDVVYAAGDRVADVHAVVFDVSDKAVNATEVLAFSSTSPSGATFRVVVFVDASDPSRLHVRCSHATATQKKIDKVMQVLADDDAFSIDKLVAALWEEVSNK